MEPIKTKIKNKNAQQLTTLAWLSLFAALFVLSV
jgi:hypothetical protein